MPDSVTQIRNAGPVGSKRNLAILGDGFADADQATYNDWVQNSVLGGVFGNDYFYEDASAWNIGQIHTHEGNVDILESAHFRHALGVSGKIEPLSAVYQIQVGDYIQAKKMIMLR